MTTADNCMVSPVIRKKLFLATGGCECCGAMVPLPLLELHRHASCKGEPGVRDLLILC